jgi:hypothetical protein
MAYWLEIDQECVVRYFREVEGLSRLARLTLAASLQRDLREHGDTFRAIPELRLAPGSACFQYEIVIKDGGRLRMFRFIVNDANAENGVLHIVYVDELPSHAPRADSQ